MLDDDFFLFVLKYLEEDTWKDLASVNISWFQNFVMDERRYEDSASHETIYVLQTSGRIEY